MLANYHTHTIRCKHAVGSEREYIESAIEKENLHLKKEYKYSDKQEMDNIIDITKNGDNLSIVISKGIINDTVYQDKKVNELGNVPIMMYHGIVDTKENKYTGGNVDKDGYNRTADAFRKDLEFYYEKGYRMIRLDDYVKGIVDVELGFSPIILTFDDGNKNNINILGNKRIYTNDSESKNYFKKSIIL